MGKFVDRERNNYRELMHDKFTKLSATIRRNGGMLMPANRDPNRRIWRPGRDSLGHRHRQSRLHLPATAIPP